MTERWPTENVKDIFYNNNVSNVKADDVKAVIHSNTYRESLADCAAAALSFMELYGEFQFIVYLSSPQVYCSASVSLTALKGPFSATAYSWTVHYTTCSAANRRRKLVYIIKHLQLVDQKQR